MVQERQKMIQIPLTDAQQIMLRERLGVDVECSVLNYPIGNHGMVLKYRAPVPFKPDVVHMYLEPWQKSLIGKATKQDVTGLNYIELIKESAQKVMYRPPMLFDGASVAGSL